MAKGSKGKSKGKSGGKTLLGPQTNGKISAPSTSGMKGKSAYGTPPKGYSK